MNAELSAMRVAARAGRDPTCAEETLSLLVETAKRTGANTYLEIGAGEGLTSAALFLETGVEVTAVEKDPSRARAARENFARFGVRGTVCEGDAAEILPRLVGPFDLIFLDGPKAQYRVYLDDCLRLLAEGGTLFADDVLLYGWVRGEPPKKRKMLVEHIREFLARMEKALDTTYYEYGEGLAVGRKRP